MLSTGLEQIVTIVGTSIGICHHKVLSASTLKEFVYDSNRTDECVILTIVCVGGWVLYQAWY